MKKPTEKPKMYIVRKYIMATSAGQAIRKDKTTPVHDAWVSDDWKGDQSRNLADAIGYHVIETQDEEE